MEYHHRLSLEYYSTSAYLKREEQTRKAEERIQAARAMFVDPDFKDRLYLYMDHLEKLLVFGYGVDRLPYYGSYFDEGELERLAEYSRLCDDYATPEDILVSLEEVFPCISPEVDGVRQSNNDRYLKWIRKEKVCVPGTLRGIQAEEILKIHLEEEELEKQREKEEQEKEEHLAVSRKKAAQRRKETREKRKKEISASDEELHKSESEECSEPAPPSRPLRPSGPSRTRKIRIK